MMIEQLAEAINHINIGLLLILTWFFILQVRKIHNGVYPVIMTIGSLANMFGYKHFGEFTWFALTTTFLMYTTNFFLYFFVKSLYSTRVQFKLKQLLLYVSYVIVCMVCYYVKFSEDLANQYEENMFFMALKVLPNFLNLFIAGLIIRESILGIKDDLINFRIQFRKWLSIILSFVIASNTIWGIGYKVDDISPIIDLLFNLITFIPIIVFVVANLTISKDFFVPIKLNEQKPALDEEYIKIKNQLESLIEEKVYLKEGISVYQLADKIGCKDYKLRKLINTELGYRNFNDFLNYYRVKEAQDILRKKENKELTVLEIAYSLGYNSISPFNTAFKSITGKTPTEYRKSKKG